MPQTAMKSTVEMPGLWKAWKAKSRLPTLSTSPLEISPKTGEISTFPQRRRRGPWKSGKPKAGFPLSHRPDFSFSKNTKTKARGRAVARPRANAGGAARRLQKPKKGESAQPAISGSSRIGMKLLFQARLALESFLDFRLISGLENAGGRYQHHWSAIRNQS
jgi:hypothetical protein